MKSEKPTKTGRLLPDDRVILRVDLGGQVLGPGAAGHREDQVLFPDDLLEVLRAGLGGRRDVVDLLVGGEDERTEVDGIDPEPLLEEPDGPVERALFAPGADRWTGL